jgi:hypothetical protein
MNTRPLFDAFGGVRVLGDTCNDTANAYLDRRGNGLAELEAISRYPSQISGGLLRVFDIHARRNAWNAAATSCSVATPLASA